MKKTISFREYRNLDLLLWAIIFTVFEFIICKVSNSETFADQSFTVSLSGAIITILYMRWGAFGILHAVLAGFMFCFFSGGDTNQYIIYILGNAFSALALIVLKKAGHEKVRTGKAWFLFPVLVLFLMQTGRTAVSVILGNGFLTSLGFYTTEVITDLFTIIIICIVKNLDGVYENQKHYLLRIHKDDGENDKPEDGGFIV